MEHNGLLEAVSAVLLDMDGTLVESDAAVERAWNAWAAEYDLDPAAVVAIAHGTPAERTVSAMLPDLAPDEVARAAARQLMLQYDDLSDVVPTYGAERLISVLARRTMPWAVVTSADRRLARARLHAAGIPVPVLITSEDVTAGKPAPDAYLLAARTLGVLASRCLVVEDAEPGLRAGRAAGALTAALKSLDGDIRLSDLEELADLLDTNGPEPSSPEKL
jgi:mannitol-1-/sugar-/sorbitol-6-phosphatase